MEKEIDIIYETTKKISDEIKSYVTKNDNFVMVNDYPTWGVTFFDGSVEDSRIYALSVYDNKLCAYIPPTESKVELNKESMLEDENWYVIEPHCLLYYHQTILNIAQSIVEIA